MHAQRPPSEEPLPNLQHRRPIRSVVKALIQHQSAPERTTAPATPIAHVVQSSAHKGRAWRACPLWGPVQTVIGKVSHLIRSNFFANPPASKSFLGLSIIRIRSSISLSRAYRACSRSLPGTHGCAGSVDLATWESMKAWSLEAWRLGGLEEIVTYQLHLRG